VIFVDTNIAIALRDIDVATHMRVAALPEKVVISMLTRIELENGLKVSGAVRERRRELLDRLLVTLPVIMFTDADILAYAAIVDDLGYDRRTTLDRLIAAQAIARGATLITRNGRDFRRIAGLKLEEW
jgi:predicted nucleic acid-binding protein